MGHDKTALHVAPVGRVVFGQVFPKRAFAGHGCTLARSHIATNEVSSAQLSGLFVRLPSREAMPLARGCPKVHPVDKVPLD